MKLTANQFLLLGIIAFIVVWLWPKKVPLQNSSLGAPMGTPSMGSGNRMGSPATLIVDNYDFSEE